MLSPGSVVSFYFDGRIRDDVYSAEVRATIDGIISQSGEVVVGKLGQDGIRIDAEIVAGPDEFAEFLLQIQIGSRVFYGVFPARDNDATRAVTLTLPDADGIVRSHPH